MHRNLYGEIVVTPSEVVDKLLPLSKMYKFSGRLTKKAAAPVVGEGLDTLKRKEYDYPGFYIIYRNGQCIYVGCSKSSIAKRLTRFIKAVYCRLRFDESHPAGKKYQEMYGRENVDGLTVQICEFVPPPNMEMESIERELIHRLKPIFNIKYLF
jgi:hypothetical protein